MYRPNLVSMNIEECKAKNVFEVVYGILNAGPQVALLVRCQLSATVSHNMSPVDPLKATHVEE